MAQLHALVRNKFAGDHFLLPDNNMLPCMLILSTTSNLRHLAAADTIFCDGTVYTCPSLFHQLIDGSMYPLVFGLFSGKDQTNYIRFFSHIKDLSRQQKICLQPQTVFIDSAVTTVFPGVTIKGCFFHYTSDARLKSMDYRLTLKKTTTLPN